MRLLYGKKYLVDSLALGHTMEYSTAAIMAVDSSPVCVYCPWFVVDLYMYIKNPGIIILSLTNVVVFW